MKIASLDISTGLTVLREATSEETSELQTYDGAATQYRRDRAAAYPPIGDQLDALWKGGDAAAEMLAQVQAVKAAYPKPE
jgi:hypothetical protein